MDMNDLSLWPQHDTYMFRNLCHCIHWVFPDESEPYMSSTQGCETCQGNGRVGIRLLVTGSRTFIDEGIVRSFLESFRGVEVLIQGGAKGVDTIARKIGLEMWGAPKVRTYYAKWREFGWEAGLIRNTEMLEEGKPNRVLAFFSDLTASRGTSDMVYKAVNLSLLVRCYDEATKTHFYATKACKYPNSLDDLCNPQDVMEVNV